MSLETMTKIATYTVTASGGDSSVTFSNIPQGYTDLAVKISVREAAGGSATDDLLLQVNSSTGLLSSKFIYANGANVYSTGYSGMTNLWIGSTNDSGSTARTFASFDLYFNNYSGNTFKSFSSESVTENNTSGSVLLFLTAGLYSSSQPITSLTFSCLSSNVAQYSSFTLYGVKNATKTAGNSIKATGGNIAFDGTYVTHTFTSSGTFTPTQSILADCLIVAGGGAGGASNGGGGGAGGLMYGTSLSLTSSTNYTVTIGAGGNGAAYPTASTNGSDSVFSTYTAIGGGAGGNEGSLANEAGKNGGSAGAGAGYRTGGTGTNAGGTATQTSSSPFTGFGNNGGSGLRDGTQPFYTGGGGGGAAAAGANATDTTCGAGGNGKTYSISGSSVTYAGGGGGGAGTTNPTAGGAGGTGGGGAGGTYTGGGAGTGAGTAGTANLGGGGGGGANGGNGANGGSGIVIIRYKG